MSVEVPVFQISDYLDQRSANPNFVMVEIGYGGYPIVDQQPGGFSGQRAYIGIEAAMRTNRETAEIRAELLREEHYDSNAFFVLQHVGDGQVLNPHSNITEYAGEYDPTTILPDEAAEEIVAINVFSDPIYGRDFKLTMSLLKEMSRLATNDGMVVLRETLTPTETVYIRTHRARQAGLKIVEKVTPSDTATWEKLEAVYGTHKDWYESGFPLNPDSYYLFLAKTVSTEIEPKAIAS